MSLVILNDDVAVQVQYVVAEHLMHTLDQLFVDMMQEDKDHTKQITSICRTLEEIADQHMLRVRKSQTKQPKVEVNF